MFFFIMILKSIIIAETKKPYRCRRVYFQTILFILFNFLSPINEILLIFFYILLIRVIFWSFYFDFYYFSQRALHHKR